MPTTNTDVACAIRIPRLACCILSQGAPASYTNLLCLALANIVWFGQIVKIDARGPRINELSKWKYCCNASPIVQNYVNRIVNN